MKRSRFSWRRLAALAAVGWATAGLHAQAQDALHPAATASRATHLTAETRAGSTLSPVQLTPEAAPAASLSSPAATVAPAAVQQTAPAPALSHASMQRTTYQQPHGLVDDPAPSPADRLMNQYATANRAYIGEPLTPAIPPEPIAPGACSPCGPDGGCGPAGGCNPCNCFECCGPYFYNNGWYVGAEYLHLRPNFRSPAGVVERTTFVDPNTNASVITDRIIAYEIDYDSTFRIFGGYRWGDCGESLQFSYWTVDANESFTAPPATQALFFASFNTAIADAPGEVLRSDFSMDLDVWDIDYIKRIPIRKGGPAGCNQCCPAWDVAWSLGVRIADYERIHNNSVVNAAGVPLSIGMIQTTFTGAGPRAGLEGRRYFGQGGKWSAYGVSHFALLLGDYETRGSTIAGITTTLHEENFIRTSPVAELEVGLSRQIGCRTLLTAGYQFQAWWDIGRFDTILVGDCECLTSSNVLSLDGFFVRLEHTFGRHCRPRCP